MSDAPVLELRGVNKRFGAVQALTDVDFWVNEGEVVALVGDNGAGKSTLVKVLAGVHAPDTGTIEFDGALVDIPSPADAQDLGIATIFQDLALCDNLDVVANLWLGRELRDGLGLDEVDMEQRTWTLLRELSAKIPSVRIHGAWVLVIPPSDQSAQVVPRAGHMVAMSHGEVVAEFLRGVVKEAGR